MTYGYNADVVFGNTTADVLDHAKSLLGSLIDERESEEVRHDSSNQLRKQSCSTHAAL